MKRYLLSGISLAVAFNLLNSGGIFVVTSTLISRMSTDWLSLFHTNE
jgi:hypothetical protein